MAPLPPPVPPPLVFDQNFIFACRRFTRYPHLAGTAGDERLAGEIYGTWVRQGLDYVTNDTYDVLLSYPDRSDPSYVRLLDAGGNEVYRSQAFEKILSADQNHSDVVPPFNAYSPPGHVNVSTLPCVSWRKTCV